MRGNNKKARLLARAGVVAILALVATTALAMGAGAASAHEFGFDSVNNGEIRYEDHTQFGDARRFGVKKWNKLDSISIRQASSGASLEFRDYNCKDGNMGYYLFKSGADTINFNVREMNKLSKFNQRGTAVHELGHALGLAHPGEAKHWCEDSVMYYTFCDGNPNTPQAHDKKDYYELWGRGDSAAKRETSGAKRSDAGPSTMEPLYAFDAKDKRKLVGYATNVFVGRVGKETGSEGAPLSGPGKKTLPKTQFSVEVSRNIKGDLGGDTVTVSQTGGYDEEGREARVEGDSPLRPGQEYLFSTSYDEEEGRYVIVAQPFGAVLIEGEEQRGEAEERFVQAEAEQIPPDPTNS